MSPHLFFLLVILCAFRSLLGHVRYSYLMLFDIVEVVGWWFWLKLKVFIVRWYHRIFSSQHELLFHSFYYTIHFNHASWQSTVNGWCALKCFVKLVYWLLFICHYYFPFSFAETEWETCVGTCYALHQRVFFNSISLQIPRRGSNYQKTTHFHQK